MSRSLDRRRFLSTTARCGALAVVGDLSFLRALPLVAAEEARVGPRHVQLRPEIEPLVRLLEETPRDRLLEVVAGRIRDDVSYRQILAALMLAGVRGIKPQPVGFKFHAVLVVNAAHQASLASPDSDRWLPLFWALDYFKGAQAADDREGDWRMPALKESDLPPPTQARRRFSEAMERWDEAGADAAVAQLARTAGASEVIELFWRYGARDFQNIGHKAIFAANAWGTLQVIGWEHAEPILRSLAFGLLAQDRNRETQEANLQPWRSNLERVKRVREDWRDGKADSEATADLIAAMRAGSPEEASEKVVALLNRGVAAASLWTGVMSHAGALLMARPGIGPVHAVTSAHALHSAGEASGSDETRLLMLLQAAAFMAMFRERLGIEPAQTHLSPLEQGAELKATGPAAIEEIFAEVSRDRAAAARKTIAFLRGGGPADELMTAWRRLVFLKGNDAHDYKLCAAAMEEYPHVSPAWRDLYLATGMFYLPGSGDRDNPLVARTRAALKG